MSADMEIQIYRRSDAIMVPIDAVEIKEGNYFVRVEDENGKIKEVLVEPGITTLDSVEVLKGLGPGKKLITEK